MKIHRKEKFLAPPRAVLLDLDNTLYSYDDSHELALRTVRNKLIGSMSISAGDFERAYVTARDEVKKNLSGTASSHSRLLYFKLMLEHLGLKSQPLLALDLEQTYWRSFLDGAKVFEGVEEFLDELRILGIPSAFVTDLTTQVQLRKMIFFGFDRLVDFVVTSEEAGADKPDARPFRIALGKIGLSGGSVWMIGDSLERDVRGARNAIGATTIQKIHKGVQSGTGPDGPDASIKEFSELRRFLLKLTTGVKNADD